MHVCCFCYMYSRFEKLCRACMLWYVSTLNKTLFIHVPVCDEEELQLIFLEDSGTLEYSTWILL